MTLIKPQIYLKTTKMAEIPESIFRNQYVIVNYKKNKSKIYNTLFYYSLWATTTLNCHIYIELDIIKQLDKNVGEFLGYYIYVKDNTYLTYLIDVSDYEYVCLNRDKLLVDPMFDFVAKSENYPTLSIISNLFKLSCFV